MASPRDPRDAQLELEHLLAVKAAGDAGVVPRIAEVAIELGLDPAEVEGLDLGDENAPLVGELFVRRRFRDVFGRGNRITRLVISPDGSIGIPDRTDRLIGADVVRITWANDHTVSGRELERIASEVVNLEIELRNDATLRLARGPLWRVDPEGPIRYVHLERRLIEFAEAAGMTVERTPTGFVATRAS